ncbi:MAG: GTPase HflX [Candidatus Omnitrophica bacterium]|nr:GTPase HflX [Candidatus Omnitrophota bacterium]
MGLYEVKKEMDRKERALLVAVEIEGSGGWNAEEKAEELTSLALSAGVDVVECLACRRKKPSPELFVGSGKAGEIAERIEEREADAVIFSEDLTPSQQKNLEKALGVKVIDRTQLILDIFASRAFSSEGKVQVELAQLEYLLPRLSRMWLHLGKQAGGIGTKGPGEQQLEVDRRRVRERIAKLKRELKAVKGHRAGNRSKRDRFSTLTIAMVGYTNSGKSTLFNALTGGRVKARNQLFSTLDPTVRKWQLSNNQTVLLSDTVGFLHDLPHHLIESFKATLEEVVNADLLFHVIDASEKMMEKQIASVNSVLEELGAGDIPVVVVFNKIDKIGAPETTERLKKRCEAPAAAISALKRKGLEEIEDIVTRHLQKDMEDIELELPHKHYSIARLIREKGALKKERYTDKGLFISARVPRKIKFQIFKKLKDNA